MSDIKKQRGNGLKKVFLDFSKVKNMTLGELYGTTPVPITELTKRLWALIKEKNLRAPNVR